MNYTAEHTLYRPQMHMCFMTYLVCVRHVGHLNRNQNKHLHVHDMPSLCVCNCAFIHISMYIVLVISLVATAKLVSQQREIGILRGDDLILPTQLIFESSGFCGLHATVSAARLQFSPFNSTNRTTLVLCEPTCIIALQELNGITYDFENYGNITVPNAEKGLYMMGMQQPCPSPSVVITATYTVTYSSPGI